MSSPLKLSSLSVLVIGATIFFLFLSFNCIHVRVMNKTFFMFSSYKCFVYTTLFFMSPSSNVQIKNKTKHLSSCLHHSTIFICNNNDTKLLFTFRLLSFISSFFFIVFLFMMELSSSQRRVTCHNPYLLSISSICFHFFILFLFFISNT